MLLRNDSPTDTVNFKRAEIGHVYAKPGQEVEVMDAYCIPRPGEAHDSWLPSVIECLAPQLKPVDPDEPMRVYKARKDLLKKVATDEIPDMDEMVKAGIPREVARNKVVAAQTKKSLRESAKEDGE